MVDTSKMTFSELADSVTALEDTLYDTRQQLEQAQARNKELAESCVNLSCGLIAAVETEGPIKALVLRKQAEAVETLAPLSKLRKEWTGADVSKWIRDQAQRLHQQADEIKKAGGEN